MSIHAAPATSTSRGEVVLQPNYFTSSVYVNALRDDISTLVLRYHEAYSQPSTVQPFPLFKQVWLSMGWNWLQFKVFDSRSRQSFLDVTVRLFLGELAETVTKSKMNSICRKNCEDRGTIYSGSCSVRNVSIFLYSSERLGAATALHYEHTDSLRHVLHMLPSTYAEYHLQITTYPCLRWRTRSRAPPLLRCSHTCATSCRGCGLTLCFSSCPRPSWGQ